MYFLMFLGSTAFAQSHFETAYTFSTLVGESRIGSADGVGSAARFSTPSGVAVDIAGDLYVADTDNHTIRKITAAGVVSTLAGFAGTPGNFDGAGSNARFSSPEDVAVDNAGNLYVTDSGNATIRKITSSGVVTTLAGLAGNRGIADGTGSNARFRYLGGIAVDSSGDLYVTDHHTIRRITAFGVVSTIAGDAESSGSEDGTGSNARFNSPQGLAVDSSGSVYVADTYNHTIRKITSEGVVSTFAGMPGSFGIDDGTLSDARFGFLWGVAVDHVGDLFVADTSSSRIRKITLAGVVSTLAGGNRGLKDGTGSEAHFGFLSDIAMDSVGNLYAPEFDNHTIRKITSAGVVNTLAGLVGNNGFADGTGSNARFNSPRGIAVDGSRNLYVAEFENSTIRKITSAGVVSTLAGLAGSPGNADGAGSNARFSLPVDVAVDNAGNLYVADSGNATIRKITSSGVVSTLAGSAGNFGSNDGTGSNARFRFLGGIAVDSSGDVYVTDDNTIRKITPIGVVSTIAGLAGMRGSDDGPATSARFALPSGVAVDSAGNLYVADTGNATIRKITPAGIVSTLAGLAQMLGSDDGPATNARFFLPVSVGVDGMGNTFVCDTYNHTIRKINFAGVVSTVGGLATSSGSTDGSGSKARFNEPFDFALDAARALYVADTGNNTIRKGVFTQYTPTNPVHYASPPMNGQLTVILLPPEANGQWRFPWEPGWRSSGSTAIGLVIGNYPIEFKNVPGYLTLRTLPVQVTGGAPTTVTNEYFPTISAGDISSNPGNLIVYLGPTPPNGGGWRFLGENTPFLSTGYSTNLSSGNYLVEFAFVSGRIKPPTQLVQINSGTPTVLSLNYLLAAAPPAGVDLPFRVPTDRINDLGNYPFGFNGQLQSDVGYGSGVAVESNVVLTAAHLVFNDQNLSYVSQAHWFFRRDVGISEPLPQAARGWYVLSGYATQRTNDLQSGYFPDQSTPPSRNVDVAALYFLLPVAGGGHGGYLPSDAVPNTWLTSTALKMLAGYPIDGSQFGDAGIEMGKMYQTSPQPYPLNISPDPVPMQQQVYTAPWFLSYSGNSGGPLYVQLNGYYYPAAVYLGTLFSGAQPYASIVRAIDSNVVNIITLAARLGDSGTNNTGGGVITVIPSQAINAKNPGYVQLQLGPPAALRAGAAWRLQGDRPYSTATNYTRKVDSTNAVVVEFKEIPGWILPTTQALALVPNDFRVLSGFYTVGNPVLMADRTLGLGIIGTTGTVYRIESRASFDSHMWVSQTSPYTISSNSFNIVLPPRTNGPPIFYRAVWVP